MPPKVKITKEDILSAAVQLVREEGAEALSARTLAGRLGCSTQPIFSNFPNMDALHQAVLAKAYEIYVERTFSAMDSGRYPPYKASGMAYIEFAVQEPQLFRLLYMRDRSGEEYINDTAESERIVELMMQSNGLSSESAHRLHNDLWVVVHGLAAMYATGFEAYHEEKASAMLSEIYFGVLERMKREETEDDGNQAEISDETV